MIVEFLLWLWHSLRLLYDCEVLLLLFKFDLWLFNWFDLIRGNMILLIKNFHLEMTLTSSINFKKKLIERSRVCHNHKPQPTLDIKRKRKRRKPYTRKTNKKNVQEAQRPAPSPPSEVIRMLKQTEKWGQRAREDVKTLSAPWYKPQSYTKLRITSGPPP